MTATDGNHGRAVARMARCSGSSEDLHAPRGVRPRRTRPASAARALRPGRADQPYDDVAVTAAASTGGSRTSCSSRTPAGTASRRSPAGSSTATPPCWPRSATSWPLTAASLTHVLVPVGVGSLAQADLQHYRSGSAPAPRVDQRRADHGRVRREASPLDGSSRSSGRDDHDRPQLRHAVDRWPGRTCCPVWSGDHRHRRGGAGGRA